MTPRSDPSACTRPSLRKALGNTPSPAAARLALPVVERHPNRVGFEGVLTLIDTPSDRAPDGARGHRIVLTREAVEAALPSLLGMAVNFKDDWSGHNPRQKAGIITEASIEDNQLRVWGLVYARDFPEMVARAGGEDAGPGDRPLGMSFEMVGGHVRDMRSKVWRLSRLTFVGAAVLERERAAWRSSSFRILPAADAAADASSTGSLSTEPTDHRRAERSSLDHPRIAEAQTGSAGSVAA